MRKRKGLALILALALGVTWCLADEANVDTEENDFEETVEEEYWADEYWEDENWEDEYWEDEGVSADNPFPDVPDDADYFDAVTYLAEAGIITGDLLGYFNPDDEITRAEVAAVICRLMGAGDNAALARNQTYGDVSGHWAEGYITTATELGIFNGDGTGMFRPGDNVTYQEMIKMLVCVMGREPEAKATGGWPNGYLSVGEDLGITTGVSFVPTVNAPRSAVAQLIYNAR